MSKKNFNPNVFEDIKSTIKIKTRALKSYKQELKNYPHPRSLKAIINLSKYRGATIGAEYVEAFILARQING